MPKRRLVLTPAALIKPRRVRWLWEGRVALGTLALLAGREGLGKSTLAYCLAAMVTRGDMPGEHYGTPKSVLICASEDSWSFTIVPRLIAARADLARIYRVEVLSSDNIHLGLSLPRDLREVEDSALSVEATLLLLDPLMSRIDEAIDTHRDAEVRRALEPLVAVADKTGMAVLGLMHHNKSASNDPLQLVMASKAFTAVARSVHTVVPDPEDETEARRLFGTPKNNLGRSDLPTLGFTIVSHAIETEDGTAWTGRLEWGAEGSGTIADAMRQSAGTGEDKGAAVEAAGWLEDHLTINGGSDESSSIKAAGRKAGHSEAALHRARGRLKVETESRDFPRKTWWSLPETQIPDPAPQSFHPVVANPRGDEITETTETTGGSRSSRSSRSSRHGDDITGDTTGDGNSPPLPRSDEK